METIKRFYRIDRRQIAYFKFILEAYDGIAMLRTLDAEAGRVMLCIAPGCEDDVDMLLTDLKKEMRFETVSAGV